MYKTFTAEEYKKHLELPEDYRVDGMLCYGTWDKVKHVQIFKEAIEQSGKQFDYGTLPSFLGKMLEFNIEGKHYWFDVSYGGALLSEFLHLACLFGSRKNILLGTCGGLATEIGSLDLIIPTYSWGNESATRMYNPAATDNKHYADPSLSESIKNGLGSEFKIWEGGTTTCQAMMAETLQDVQNWSKEGFLGVEMEAATVFAVSKHFNVPSAALLIVGDNLIQGETVGSESYNANKPQKEKIKREQFRVALNELLAN
jgi:purine-nucleoside phosphorylase